MRLVKVLLAAGALAAVIAAPTRAQDYTKTTMFTFSQPVQLPGMTLPAGEYMFKLANPESGRRAIGVWDKDGQKFYGMALTVADESMRKSDPPVAKDSLVLFREAPAGEPQAVRSWFYIGDSIGYEFIYPNAQAAKIARASGESVLATNSNEVSGQVGRVDSSGRFSASADATTASTTSSTTTTTTATAARSSATTASSTAANRAEPQTPAASAQSSTTAQSATSTTARPATTTTAPATTAQAQADTAVASPHPSPETAAARAAAAPSQPRAVGTAGQAANTLPQTAGAGALLQLTGFALIGAGAAVRGLRRRSSASS